MKTKLTRREFLKLGAVGGLLVASYPVFIERYLFQVNTYRIGFKNLPDEFHGFRIAHLTDLHYGFLMPDWIIRYIVQRTNQLNADMIVCTGDYVHEDDSTTQITQVWPILSELEAKYGVYSVLGNHDHWADPQASLDFLNRSGQNIRHQTKPIQIGEQKIWISGAGDLWEDDLGIDTALESVPPDEFKIVLAHNPDSADLDYQSRFDLMISGHTHGGQVRLPFIGTPMLPVNNKLYSSGLFETKNNKLFISKGLGWTIYPIRFNCAPEIAILELVQIP